MAANGDDLDLLLSLREDRVLETPPASPSYDGSPKRRSTHTQVDMSVFRDAVKDYLHQEPKAASTAATKPNSTKGNKNKRSDEIIVEKFSGLRIRNSTMSPVEVANHFADIRFVRLSAIKNVGDSLSGCWATIGVLLEKGTPKASSSGKTYSICKYGSLDGSEVSVFLFDGSHINFSGETVGAVFAFLNANVRRDNTGKGFSMSVNSASQMMKLGVAADFATCKGKRKDGMTCSMVINKCKGPYCKFHATKASEKYTSGRAELKGGNFQRSYRPPQYEGVYMVDPLERSSQRNKTQQVKHISIEGLKKALSKADKVTSRSHSQGIRFLSHVTTNELEIPTKNQSQTVFKNQTEDPARNLKSTSISSENNKRAKTCGVEIGSKRSAVPRKEPESKREKTCNPSEKTIDLEIVSSDEEDFWSL